MKEKKIFAFSEAKLVEGGDRWYVDYFLTNQYGQRIKRLRPTFFLNKIKDERVRRQVGNAIVKEFNALLEKVNIVDRGLQDTPLKEAFPFMYQTKIVGLAASSIKPYKAFYKSIMQYIKAKKMEDMCVADFSAKDAFGFMEFLSKERQIKNRTYNNYRRDGVIYWNLLADYDYVPKNHNPFKVLSKKRNEQVNYRKIEVEDQKVINQYLLENDYWLFVATLLLRYCTMRPVELTRLQIKHFNFNNGTIFLGEDVVYKSKPRYVTMPKVMQRFLMTEEVKQLPPHYFLFGKYKTPGRVAIKEDRMTRRFKGHLQKLKKSGKLKDIEGYKFYSNKKSGISASLQSMHPESVRQQTGHADYKVLLLYNENDQVNEDMLNFDDGLLKELNRKGCQ